MQQRTFQPHFVSEILNSTLLVFTQWYLALFISIKSAFNYIPELNMVLEVVVLLQKIVSSSDYVRSLSLKSFNRK